MAYDSHCHTLCFVHRRANVECFFANDLKRSFGIHQEIDRHLAHVDDKTPVTTATADDVMHESHEVEGLVFNFGRRALQRVRSHSILILQERMGNQKALHSAAAHYEALFTELR